MKWRQNEEGMMDRGGRKINKVGEVSRPVLFYAFRVRKSEKLTSSTVLFAFLQK